MTGPPYRNPGTPPGLTAEDLRDPVRTLLAEPTARVRDFACEPIGYESWSRASDGLYVVRGTASSDQGDHTWEAVLKQIRHRRWQPSRHDLARQIDDGGDGPGDWAYWRREALALASPVPGTAAGRFAAVRCLGIVPLPGDRIRLWLEKVDGRPGDDWAAGELLDSAEALGGFHARSQRQRSADRTWWCRPFVEQAALQARFTLIERAASAATCADPALRRLFPRTTVTALQSLARGHDRAVRTLRSLPAGLVHRDLTPGTCSGPAGARWRSTGARWGRDRPVRTWPPSSCRRRPPRVWGPRTRSPSPERPPRVIARGRKRPAARTTRTPSRSRSGSWLPTTSDCRWSGSPSDCSPGTARPGGRRRRTPTRDVAPTS